MIFCLMNRNPEFIKLPYDLSYTEAIIERCRIKLNQPDLKKESLPLVIKSPSTNKLPKTNTKKPKSD